MEWKALPSDENESNQPVIGRTIIHGRVSVLDYFLPNTILKMCIFTLRSTLYVLITKNYNVLNWLVFYSALIPGRLII